jgi:hypothetical protein
MQRRERTEAGPSSAGDEPSAKPSDPRVALRVDACFRAEYRGHNVHGTGCVRNLSITGALIEEAEPLLLSGGEISIRFPFFETSLPIEIAALVVRETPGGFGVRFKPLERRLQQLLSVAIARSRQLGIPPVELGAALLAGAPRRL